MAKSMNELLEIITATDPEAGEEFLKLLEPQKYDRFEMGSILEATLGNDLTVYYDAKEANDHINAIIEHSDIPNEVKEFVDENRDVLVEDAMNAYQLTRSAMITSSIDARIEDETGFNVTDFIPLPDDDEFLFREAGSIDDETPFEDPVDENYEEEREEEDEE